MKKFKIPCIFNEKKVPFDLYIGEPADDLHPLQFQKRWLLSERGGIIPKEVLDSFSKLQGIAIENNVSFEELCMYALGSAEANKDDNLNKDFGDIDFKKKP